MPNRNYIRGRRKEYKAIALLEASGYSAVRTAGSHSAFDVIGWSSLGVRFIQLKVDRISAVEREHLQLLRVPPGVSKEVWIWEDRAKAPVITIIK
jgi:hypothetical protein